MSRDYIAEENIRKNLSKTDIIEDTYIGERIRIHIRCIVCNNTRSILPKFLLNSGIGNKCDVCVPENSIVKKPVWTKEQEQFLIDNYSILTGEELAIKLNKTRKAIFNKGSRLKLKKDSISRGRGQLISLDLANIKLRNKFPELTLLTYTKTHDNCEVLSSICGHVSSYNYSYLTNSDVFKYTCKLCVPAGISGPEKELLNFIKENYSGWIIENDRINIAPQELDIVLPDLGLAFEYNGIYWHSDKHKSKSYHIDKTNLLKSNMGYQLIHVNSDEWENKQDIVKSRILSLLGKSTRIHARKCVLKEIGFPRDFLSANHLQGFGSPSTINLGLFYADELVATMTFSKPRFTSSFDYELVRYCSKLNTNIVGGASKLLAYFNNHYVGSIVSYSDKRWSEGNLYKKLGFEYSHTSDPNYRYYKGSSSLSRYQCQKHKLSTLFPTIYADEKTEAQIMDEAGYYRVYDCGNDVWIIP